ncbi:MAG: hypothetical protein AAF709_11455 [Pseudomonadota bacterium]
MTGPRQVAQRSLFYEFSIQDHVPSDRVLRKIDQHLHHSDVRSFLARFYSQHGRPPIDPEQIIRMLPLG